jgi:uncharacterized RDD family membrane protein YckC
VAPGAQLAPAGKLLQAASERIAVMSSFEQRNFRNFHPPQNFNDELNIDTPEQVGLSYSVAGIGSRFVALLLDTLLILAFYTVAFIGLALIFSGAARMGTRMDLAGKWVLALVVLLNFLLFWGYFSLFEAFWHGQTPGKRALKLRVIKDSGRQITFFESLARNLLRLVDFLPGMYLAGVITMLCNHHNKRLGDLAAGTLVVHERAEEQPLLMHTGAAAAPGLPSQPWRSSPLEPWQKSAAPLLPADAVARLHAQDLIILERFFARMLDLPLETRAALAYRIAGQMAHKMGVPLPPGNPERALEAIAHQMRDSGRGF